MATVRKENKTVFLVVDVQVGVMRDAWEAVRVIRTIGEAVEKARGQGVPVIWVQHADEELAQGSADWQIVPELKPAEGEARIDKHYNSSFEETSLEECLARLGASHLVLAGASTNWCIRATAYAALDRGYDLTLLADAHTTGTIEFQDGRTIRAEDIISELNIAMTWLQYPGRKNAAVKMAEWEAGSAGG